MKSADELKKELAALEGMEAQAGKATEQDVNKIPLEEYLDFDRYPITDDEMKRFDSAVLECNRRRHALQGDPDPDNPQGFVASERQVQRMLSWLQK